MIQKRFSVLKAILIFLSVAAISSSFAANSGHVVVVVMDGARYSETWGDPTHVNIPKIAALATKGVVMTDFRTAASGSIAWSWSETCPGHARITTGTYQNIVNNGTELPSFQGIFQEYIKQTGKPASSAWVITSKDKLSILANTSSPGWNGKYMPSISCGINGDGTGGYREDNLTHAIVLEKLTNDHPGLMIVNYKGPDSMGHANNWNGYLSAIKEVDGYIQDIWTTIQSDPQLKGNTTLFIINDHGRHSTDFTSHGDTCDGCTHVMSVALGYKIKTNMTSIVTREQIDLVPTIADILEISAPQASGRIMTEILTTVNALDNFSFIVIPDSQFMLCSYKGGTPAQFYDQARWIKSNIPLLNVKMVSHVGDICDSANDTNQWNNVSRALAGLQDFVPFGMAYGNHDYGKFNPDYSLKYDKAFLDLGFHKTFPLSKFKDKPGFGGNFPEGVMDNNYQLFSGGGVDFISIHLGDNPDAAALSWASGILDANADRKAIISTHSYMGEGVYNVGPGSIWNDVIRSHDNVFMLVCGHDCYRENIVIGNNDFGHPVYQILTDYQCDEPQAAWLRYYTFVPSEKKIKAYTYSTVLHSFENDANSRFDIPFNFSRAALPPAVIVSSIEPKNKAGQVPLKENKISITFNSNMNGKSVAANTKLTGSGVTGVSYLSGDGTKTITLRIKGALKAGASYTIDVGAEARSSSGLGLTMAFSSSFGAEASTSIPGIIQAENFIQGPEGVAYHDTTPGNSGHAPYRPADVDIEACRDTTPGFDVGWTEAGEWLIYKINVSTKGNYTIKARVASGNEGIKSFKILIDNVDVSGKVDFSINKGWQGWDDVLAVSGIKLGPGSHTMRFECLTSGMNINYFVISNR